MVSASAEPAVAIPSPETRSAGPDAFARPQARITRREILVALGFYVACTAALFGAGLLPGRSMLRTDVVLGRDPLFYDPARFGTLPPSRIGDTSAVNIQFPEAMFAARALHHGEMPVWNPYVGMGQPCAGMQGLGPNPLFLPFWLFPCEHTYTLGLVLAFLAAALAAHILARIFGSSPSGAYVAGAGFAFSGAMIGWHNSPIPSNCATLLLALLAIEWYLRRLPDEAALRRWRKRAALSLSLTLGLLVGHPTVVPVDCAVLAGWALLRIAEEWPARGAKRQFQSLAGLAACGCVAALAAAPPWLWSLSFMKGGWCYKFLPNAAAVARNIIPEDRPLRWASLLSPKFEAEALAVLHVAPRHAAPYLGLAIVPLAIAGLLLVLRRRQPGFLSIPAVLLVGAGIVYNLPLLHALRPPVVFHYYFYHLVALPAALLASFGATWACRHSVGRRGWLVCAATMAAGLAWVAFEIWRIRAGGSRPLAMALRGHHLWGSLAGGVPGITVFLLACALAAAVRMLRHRFAFVLALAITIDLVATNRGMIEEGKPARQLAGTALSTLQRIAGPRGNARMTGVSNAAPIPNASILVGLYDVRESGAVVEGRYADFVHALGGNSDHGTWFLSPWPEAPLLRLAAARWVVMPKVSFGFNGARYDHFVPGSAALHYGSLRLTADDRYVAVYENPDAAPRAYLAQTWRAISGRAEAARTIESAASDPGPLLRTPAVEPVDGGAVVPAPTADSPKANEGNVRWNEDAPASLALTVSTRAPALLVVADSYDPGWHATLDGAPAPIHPTNLAFRGVFVPAGRHEVKMIYSPPGGRLLQTIPPVFCFLAIAFLLFPVRLFEILPSSLFQLDAHDGGSSRRRESGLDAEIVRPPADPIGRN